MKTRALPASAEETPLPRVVVINDSRSQLVFLSTLLRREGFDIVSCLGAEEALQSLKGDARVDVIITDLHMPGLDGWRLCHLLRSPAFRRFNSTPILVLSATYSGTDIEQLTEALGADAFLSSPADPAVLRACVRDLIAGKRPESQSRLALVDPDQERRSAARVALEAAGYDVACIENTDDITSGASVIVIAQSSLSCGGLTTGDALKALAGGAVVAVLHESGDADSAVDLLRGGADALLPLPLDPKALVDQLGIARRQRSLLRVESLLEDRSHALREAEARLRKLYEAMPDLAVVHDEHGTVMEINESGARWLGWKATDLIGRPLAQVAPDADAVFLRTLSRRARQRGVTTTETSLQNRTGQRLEVELRSTAIEFGRRLATLSVARDVSAKKEAERLRADFMAMLAHDIRNPLGVILGYSDMLRELGPLDAEREDILRRLEVNAQSVVTLVSNYLDLSRIEAHRLLVNPRPVDLNEVLRGVANQYEGPVTRGGVQLDLDLAPDLPPVVGDPVAMERTFTNLVHNAAKFTPAGGRIVLRSSLCGDHVRGSVVDTGPGIAPTLLPVIFDRYRGAPDQHHHSTGLGLFIAKALVEAQDGTISVESTLGKGAEFMVTLPTAAARAESVEPAA